MRSLWLNLGLSLGMSALLGATTVGCATSADDERRAERHEFRAQHAASRGDYERAAAEQRKARELRQEAGESGEVPPPAPMPPPSTPAPYSPY